MGQLKHDGRATLGGVAFPSSEEIIFGDLYRVDGWTGVALSAIDADETDNRTADMEIAPDRVWYCKMPASLNCVKGDYLYWDLDAGFQRGDTDLVKTPTGSGYPCALVEESQDANDYAAIRILNVGPSGSAT